jgi:hypothetical protein
VAQCGSCKNRRFEGTLLHIQGRKNPHANKSPRSWQLVISQKKAFLRIFLFLPSIKILLYGKSGKCAILETRFLSFCTDSCVTESKLWQSKGSEICFVMKLRVDVRCIKKPETMISPSVVRNYLRFSSKFPSSVNKEELCLSQKG